MKTNFEQVIFREQQPLVDIVDDEGEGVIQSLPPSEKHLNFIEAFNAIDR